ncbi:transglutaminase domain-containing protein [Acidaminobacter sp. JC074]|uniref:transglutaminase-like domain-containing protein n=1 Tax=Acidaminobacter sp. JC074 TaxID=2530199 RepID=UPI001F0E2631|nr:transglutaminase-like domain-containing protein [Acidaminobacter sp. JC074]MCH4890049.1 transglutaminase domain-containing protein [Acidaminobacter sp. JC074]
MKKIFIIWLIISLMTVPALAFENEPVKTSVNDHYELTEKTHVEEADHMLFVMKTSSVNWLAMNIKVQAVDATVIVNKGSTSYKNVKTIVEKDQEYIYNNVSDIEYFPLQMGSGKYTVSLLGSNDGRRYRSLTSKDFKVEVEENVVFLNSTQTVNWSDETEVSILAKALTLDLETDQEKLEAVHKHIVDNVRYNYQKAATLPKGYIPDAEATLEVGDGICYDFAALLAAMMRSVDVPTKLVKGYSSYTPVYHAWNEVLIGDEWWIVDASTDSIYVDYKVQYVINKPIEAYQASKVY